MVQQVLPVLLLALCSLPVVTQRLYVASMVGQALLLCMLYSSVLLGGEIDFGLGLLGRLRLHVGLLLQLLGSAFQGGKLLHGHSALLLQLLVLLQLCLPAAEGCSQLRVAGMGLQPVLCASVCIHRCLPVTVGCILGLDTQLPGVFVQLPM